MYRFSYSEILEDAPDLCRERERAAFDRALALLRKANAAEAPFEERGEAVTFHQRLWDVLIEDLLSPENSLPDALRNDLVSIGLWCMREASEVLGAPGRSLTALIDVNTAIRDGLR
ncbi:flagellar biosynthesis regulator FlaF [Methylobacterium oryzisoli]|uniref:flagellar biosynthesis regulator FlaF n=1 Tax=Methylobacterium oryzisoli TaxID=3385502 RepID=UPI0038926D7F